MHFGEAGSGCDFMWFCRCHGGWSRNREFGQQLGEGRTAAELIANRRTVVNDGSFFPARYL